MEQNKNYKCMRCGYCWKAKVKRPKRCPVCHSKYWNKKTAKEMMDLILS